MTQLNIADVEDSFLNADLHDEWKKEFEEEYFRPQTEVMLANLAQNIPDEELEALKSIDPQVYMEIMEMREKIVKLEERKMKEVEDGD